MAWEQIKEDEYVKNWFEQLKSEKTKQNYSERFPKFLKFVNQTGTQIIVSRLNHLVTKDLKTRRYWEIQLVKFTRHLESLVDSEGKRKLTKSSIKGIQTSVQSFFSKNGVKLQFSRGELDVEPAKREKVVNEWIPLNEQIRVIYRASKTARDRAIILTLYQSGFSSIDVSNMNIEDFNFYDNNGNWQLEPFKDVYHARLREKTNIKQQTCLSREAIEDIRIMLQNRGYPQKGFLFISQQNKQFSPRFINEMLKAIVNKIYPEKSKLWKTKHLRDSFMNGLLQASTTQELKDAMVGHKRKGARSSYGLTEETIKSAYERAFKFLTINGVGSITRKIEQVEKETKQQFAHLGKIMSEQQAKLDEQEQRIQCLQEKMRENFLKSSKTLQSMADMLRREYEQKLKQKQ